MRTRYLFVGALLIFFALVLAACQPGPVEVDQQAQAETPQPCPTAAPCPNCPTCPEPEAAVDAPFLDAWQNSPHADAEAEAFVHWNEEDPQEIPVGCAKCHSTPGYLDYLGEDGTAFREVNNPAPIGTVVSCTACHNNTASTLNSVVFPSGVEIAVENASARCMECHQGRASTAQVLAALEGAGLATEPDSVSTDIGFINIHYYAAAATLYGGEAHGGLEYENRVYTRRFEHVENYDSCAGCHNPHTLEVRVESCAACHDGVDSVEALRDIRMQGSLVDYDGDGDIEEGIYYELQTLEEMLLQAMQAYATEVTGSGIVYDPGTYPYFFVDTDADNELDEDEAAFANAYKTLTGRLLKAAYNYQVAQKDPGKYAHNAKYIVQLLYDSIEDLNQAVSTPVDLANAVRDDAGHFHSTEEAFRHWDEDGMVEAACVRCHSAAGLPMFVANDGNTISVPPSNNLQCTTCHTELQDFTVLEVEEVRFPSGAVLGFADSPESNLCMMCHQGRESKVSIDTAISRAGVGPNEPSEVLNFRNPHYFAAGATLFGTEARGAYEYEGREYNTRFVHIQPFDTCAECHDPHALELRVELCANCHQGVQTQEDLHDIRLEGLRDAVDYDGDGNLTEGVYFEIETMHRALYQTIRNYANQTAGAPIAFGPGYPYWFADPNNNGTVDQGENGRYLNWTPELLRAAYNYTWVAKDPGAFAHNNEYVLQFLYDSIQALGGDVSGMTRPEVRQSDQPFE